MSRRFVSQMHTGILVVLALIGSLASAVGGQTLKQLEKKYGPPNDGAYRINKSVSLRVDFGKDGKLLYARFMEKKADAGYPLLKKGWLKTKLGSAFTDFKKSFLPEPAFGKLKKRNYIGVGSCYMGRYVEIFEKATLLYSQEICSDPPYHEVLISFKSAQSDSTSEQNSGRF